MEPAAINLGISIKHTMKETGRLLEETKPCRATCEKVFALAHACEARSKLESVLNHVVDPDNDELCDGNVSVNGTVPFIHVFYYECYCTACTKTNVETCGTIASSRPARLTAEQLDAYVRLKIRLQVWTTQAHRFIVQTSARPPRPARLHRSTPSTKDRKDATTKAKKAIDKMKRQTSKMLAFRLNASRARINWAIVRVAVRRWKLAHILFEAKQGPSYDWNGPGQERDLQAFTTDLPQLV